MLRLVPALLLLLAVSAEVQTLTSDNFDDVVSKSSKILVEFYAPWCGHCKALEPEYKAAAEKLKEDGVDFILAKVDATKDEALAKKYQVQGFPTIKYFMNGNLDAPADYNGGRTKDDILKWVEIRTKPATTELTTEEALKSFTTTGKAKVVVFASDKADTDKVKAFAESVREQIGQVAIVTDADLTSKAGAKAGTLQLYCKFSDYKPAVYEGELTTEGMTEFVNKERFPLVDEIGPENYKDYMDRGLPLVWVSLNGTKSVVDEATTILSPIAGTFKGELSFTWVDNTKFAQHVQNLGIKGSPGLMIMGEPDKYLFEGEWNAENLKQFFEKYKAKTLEPHRKSQEAPEKNDGNVFVLVGSQFNDVIGKDKDVLLEFYAPWCGHCKQLEPEYEKVGAAFKEVDGVVIAKIDATENDTPEPIQGFPTIIFYKKGETKGISYDEDRTAKAIINFVKSKTSADVSGLKEDL